MFSRRKATHHRQDCPCPWCAERYGPADVFEAWEGAKEHKLGIAIVLVLAAFATIVALSIGGQ